MYENGRLVDKSLTNKNKDENGRLVDKILTNKKARMKMGDLWTKA